MSSTQNPRAEAAYERSAHWLMVYNELEERGKGHTQRAQDALALSARWLMRTNGIAERSRTTHLPRTIAEQIAARVGGGV